MAINEQQKTSLLGVTSFMFNYAPDQASYARFETLIDNNPSFYDLGTALGKTDAFTSQFDGIDTFEGKVDLILGRLGLEEGTLGYDRGVEFITTRIQEDGVPEGQVMMEIGEKLLQDTPPEGLEDAAAILRNKIAVSDTYLESGIEGYSSETLPELLAGITADQASVDAANEAIAEKAEEEDPGVPGETFGLTVGADNLEGTADNDTFDASIGQNDSGQIVNTLSSADKIDGGAGNDTLNASLSAEFNLAGNALKVQPTTRDVETINIEARSSVDDVVLDAKNMVGVDTFGSDYSDGDLVIQNVNTLDNEGNLRNTSDITVRMDHTDNFNSDGDASDLTVLFDDDYLIAGEETKDSLELRIVNNFELAENDSPLVDFDSVDFTVAGQKVSVDISGADTYQGVADAINGVLNDLGIEGVEASPADPRTSIFSDDLDDYEQGDLAGEYLPVNIVSSSGDLEAGTIKRASDVADFDGLNTWVAGDSQTTDDPVSVNVELEKVGRAGQGGNLEIGGKSQAVVDGQKNGIEVFNIDVLGDDSMPSSLGSITSTNDQLETINIATGADFAGTDSVADLTIRGFDDVIDEDGNRVDEDGNSTTEDDSPITEFGYNPFGENVSTVNASGFEGDLTIGTENGTIVDADGTDVDTTESYAQNVNLNADGALGDVEFNASYDANEGDDADAAGTITTGDGDDTINLIGEGNVVVNAGAGDNTVTLSENTASDTIVVDEAFGTNSITNFEAGTEGDVLDLTAYLDSMEEATDPDSEESEQRIETTVDTDDELSANEVNVKSYTGTEDVSFDDLNAGNLLEAFEFTAEQNDAVIDGNGSAVVMVENGDSAGEYKMFDVSFDSSDASTDGYDLSAGDVELIGTTNFGEDVTFDAANFA